MSRETREGRGWVRRLTSRLAAMLALSAASCSFFIDGPGRHPDPQRRPTCETSRWAPVRDAFGFGVFGAMSGFFVASAYKHRCDSSEVDCGGNYEGPDQLELMAGAVFAIPSLVYGVAALVGVTKTNRCNAAFNAYDRAHPRAPPGQKPAHR
jgi:hypothetical protein